MPAPFPDDGSIVDQDRVGQSLVMEYRKIDQTRRAAASTLMGNGDLQEFVNRIRHHRGERPVGDGHLLPVSCAVNKTDDSWHTSHATLADSRKTLCTSTCRCAPV